MNKYLKILVFFISLSIWGRVCGQVDTIVWQNKAPLPGAGRIDYASFVIDSNYYIVGGLDSIISYGEVWKYNMHSDSWEQRGNFPGGYVMEPTGFAINGNGYVCCGYDSAAGGSIDNRLWEYNSAIDSWQIASIYPGILSEAPISFVYDSFAYIGMGDLTSDLWRYIVFTGNWDSLANIPEGDRSECGVAIVDSFAYILTGFNIALGHDLGYNDIWRYNIKHDQWDSIGIMPGGLRSNGLFWTFDSLIIGGFGEEISPSGDYYFGTDIYSYHVSANKWDTLSCLNFPDSIADGATMGCFILGKAGYFFGGYKTYLDPTYYNKMWSFDASQFFPPDTAKTIDTAGIKGIKSDATFALYPNPGSHEQGFSISTSESGSISFYDALGRLLDQRPLQVGSFSAQTMRWSSIGLI